MEKYLGVKWHDICDVQMVPQKEKLRDQANVAKCELLMNIDKGNIYIYCDVISAVGLKNS